jgi:hypothetical protein
VSISSKLNVLSFLLTFLILVDKLGFLAFDQYDDIDIVDMIFCGVRDPPLMRGSSLVS